jgi:hypothetical protein
MCVSLYEIQVMQRCFKEVWSKVKTPIIGFIDDWSSKLQSTVNPVPSLNMVSHGQLDNLQTFDISSKIETHNMLV